jgi:hypothetical protein
MQSLDGLNRIRDDKSGPKKGQHTFTVIDGILPATDDCLDDEEVYQINPQDNLDIEYNDEARSSSGESLFIQLCSKKVFRYKDSIFEKFQLVKLYSRNFAFLQKYYL